MPGSSVFGQAPVWAQGTKQLSKLTPALLTPQKPFLQHHHGTEQAIDQHESRSTWGGTGRHAYTKRTLFHTGGFLQQGSLFLVAGPACTARHDDEEEEELGTQQVSGTCCAHLACWLALP